MSEHLRLLSVSENIARKKRSNPAAGIFIPREHSTHANNLQREIDAFLNKRIIEQKLDPSLIFKLDCEFNDIPLDKLHTLNCQILSNNEDDGALILFSNSVDLKEFQEKLEIYSRGNGKNKTAHYESFFSNINEIIALSPEDKLGNRIKMHGYNSDDSYWVNIELWHIGDISQMHDKVHNTVAHYINVHGGELTDTCIGYSFCTIRALISGECIDDLIKEDIIQEIDFIPFERANTAHLIRTDLADLNIINNVDLTSPSICILDSGIVENHPMLEGSIFDPTDYTDSDEDYYDLCGHGTLVSSLCQYGDMRKHIESGQLHKQFRLFPAKVLDSNGLFPEDRLPESMIIEAIKYYNSTYDCRIFNLSLGFEDDYYSGGKQFPLAQAIDELCHQLDVLVIISAGNISRNKLPHCSEIGCEKTIRDYPFYFGKSEYKIINPATASNALTIGSYDSTELLGIQNVSSHENIISIPINNGPSFYSRSGPGVLNAVKPDISIQGGAMVYDKLFQRMICDPERSPIGCNFNFINDAKLFSVDYGTSLSAPIIANMAATIDKYYNGLTANTIRALIVNSCRYNYELLDLLDSKRDFYIEKLRELLDNSEQPILETEIDRLTPEQLVKQVLDSHLSSDIKDFARLIPDRRSYLNLIGYGHPSLERALSSTTNTVTMYGQDRIQVDKFKIYEVPIPESINQISGGKYLLQVTLAHSPRTRHTRNDYLGYTLDLQIFRNTNVHEVTEALRSRSGSMEEALDALPPTKKISDTSFPTRTNVKTSTVKNYTAQFTRAKISQTNSLLLVVTCEGKWIDEDFEDNFSVVATFEHLNTDVNLYSEIESAINTRLQTPTVQVQYRTPNIIKTR